MPLRFKWLELSVWQNLNDLKSASATYFLRADWEAEIVMADHTVHQFVLVNQTDSSFERDLIIPMDEPSQNCWDY